MYSSAQLAALHGLLLGLAERFGIPADRILGHREADPSSGKSCPLLDMDRVRARHGALVEVLRR